jgi:glycogen debranching enzyme
MPDDPLTSAYGLVVKAVMQFHGRPVGSIAARDPDEPAADNYQECFVRDFAVTALVSLADGKPEIVGNFLETVVSLLDQEPAMEGHELQRGVVPASFRVSEGERLVADFGNRAIGRVAPVDAMMWWVVLLHAYIQATGDKVFARREEIQRALCDILSLCLKGSFEVYPTLLVPDACCMIDRRMGIYGHPLEIQALFYGMLHTVGDLCQKKPETETVIQNAAMRHAGLRDYVRRHYWLDVERLSEIHRFHTEEYGDGGENVLNINPASMPPWVERWMPERGGWLVGNLGPERMDVRYFALGNLLAILFGLATERQAQDIMELYEARWEDLVGAMPVKIAYPAVSGEEWRMLTGCDPKNAPWSYHNGGNWPVLLWPFVAAALKVKRRDLAERAFETATKLVHHHWPEYYDGQSGRLIGRRANLNQTWSAAAFIFAHKLLEDPSLLSLFPA